MVEFSKNGGYFFFWKKAGNKRWELKFTIWEDLNKLLLELEIEE